MGLVCKLALTLCLLPVLLGAGVYRWVDDNGVVNYSQLKPEGIDAELVTAGTGQRVPTPASTQTASSDAPADPNDDRDLNESQREMLRDLRAAEEARQQEVARIREANCQQSRDVLQRLTSRGRIRVVGEDGQERVLPEEERQSRIDEAQRAVAANCSETASR
jgi:hypothetical protein